MNLCLGLILKKGWKLITTPFLHLYPIEIPDLFLPFFVVKSNQIQRGSFFGKYRIQSLWFLRWIGSKVVSLEPFSSGRIVFAYAGIAPKI
jgi:hypothetical protein